MNLLMGTNINSENLIELSKTKPLNTLNHPNIEYFATSN